MVQSFFLSSKDFIVFSSFNGFNWIFLCGLITFDLISVIQVHTFFFYGILNVSFTLRLDNYTLDPSEKSQCNKVNGNEIKNKLNSKNKVELHFGKTFKTDLSQSFFSSMLVCINHKELSFSGLFKKTCFLFVLVIVQNDSVKTLIFNYFLYQIFIVT